MPRAADSRPNIVLLLADNFGPRDVGVYGSTFYETPNLDWLVREGALTNGVAPARRLSPRR